MSWSSNERSKRHIYPDQNSLFISNCQEHISIMLCFMEFCCCFTRQILSQHWHSAKVSRWYLPRANVGKISIKTSDHLVRYKRCWLSCLKFHLTSILRKRNNHKLRFHSEFWKPVAPNSELIFGSTNLYWARE